MIQLTENAIKEVKRLIEAQNNPNLVLRMAVKGGGCSGLSYGLNLDTNVGEHDKVFEFDGVKVVCDMKSYLYLNGTVLEYTQDLLGGGFKFENPNAKSTCGCGTSFNA